MNRGTVTDIRGAHVLKASRIRKTMIIISLAFLSDLAQASNMEWDGFFGGLNTGIIFNTASLSSNNLGFTTLNGTCNRSADFSSFFPGVQFGYMYPLNSKVILGLEANYTYNFNKQGNAACVCEVNPQVSDQFAIKNQQQGSLRGRIAYALDKHLLPFFMVGESLANVGLNYHNEGSDFYSKNTSTFGWLVGVGLEWRVTSAWSIRTEYSYTTYNALEMGIPMTYELYDPNGGARVDLHANTVGVAFNYWFE